MTIRLSRVPGVFTVVSRCFSIGRGIYSSFLLFSKCMTYLLLFYSLFSMQGAFTGDEFTFLDLRHVYMCYFSVPPDPPLLSKTDESNKFTHYGIFARSFYSR